MRLEDLMERAAKYDENLARDIKDYVHGRRYGLVYEASKPEFVRMWKKPVVRGDIVNILPPRGLMETRMTLLKSFIRLSPYPKV